MHRSLLLAIPLLLASLAAPALAQPGPPGYRAHLDLNSAMTADTDLIDAPGSDTDLVVYASSGAKTVTSFSATISLVSTASKVYVVRKQGATTVRSWLNNGDEVPAGTDVELVWKAYSGWTYNLQVETTTSGSLIVCEVSNAVSVAGLRRSGGGGGLSSVSTTGDALSGAGTSGDPLSAAAVLEALVDGGGTATAGAGTVLDLSATGGLLTGDGSAAAPSLAFSAEPGTGFFRGGAGHAALALNGTERFGFLTVAGWSVFNAASPFRIGVNGNTVLSYNESDPGVNLGTSGALAFGTGTNDPRLVKTATDELSVRDGSGNDVTMLASIFGSKASSNLTIKTGTQTALTFAYTTNPIATFNGPVVLQNGTSTAPSLAFAGSSTSGLYYDSTLGDVSVAVGGTRYLNVTTAGISANGAVLSEGGGTAASVVIGLDNSTANGFYGNQGSDLGVSVGGKARHSWGQTRTLTDASATTVCTVGLASGEAVGVLIDYTITATSGSDIQVRTGRVIVPIRDASGTATGTATDDSQAEVSTGTLTASWTVADGTNAAVIQCNADSSLSTPTVTVYYEIALTGANPTLTLP